MPRPMISLGRVVPACLGLWLGCSGGNSTPPIDAHLHYDGPGIDEGEGLDAAGTLIGPAGGTVTGPGGVELVIPSGALTQPTLITIAMSGVSIPEAVSPVYDFQPAGLTFAKPAIVTFPLSVATNGVGVYWSQQAGGGYDFLGGTRAGLAISASVRHFSFGYVAPSPTPVGTHRNMIASELLVPTTNDQARDYGLDLDGDGMFDNQLGQVFASLSSMGFDMASATIRAVDRGDILLLLDLQASDVTTAANAGFTTRLGATPSPTPCADAGDPVCRRHLAGTGTFTIAAGSPMPAPLPGVIAGGTSDAGPGELLLSLHVGGNAPSVLPLIGARVRLPVTTATVTNGTIAGALRMTDVRDKILMPQHAQTVASQIADCGSATACANDCPAGSTGKTVMNLFDTNMDCVISFAEYEGSGLIMSLYAPDVVIDGQQALSVGVRVSAVGASF